jgi:phospholipid/cholesterol/gamma-HCH transport system substrate-binding protein
MSSEAKVGLFVIVAIAIFVVTFLAVANVQLQGETIEYRTQFRYAGGVERGATVRFGGLKAGVVTAIGASEDDPTQVAVKLELRKDVPVNEKSVASIAALSALGQNYIEIAPGSNDAPRIAPGGMIPSEETPSFTEITKKITDLADQAQQTMLAVQADIHRIVDESMILIDNLNQLTGEKNRKSVEQLLDNTNKMVAEQAPKIDQITTQVSDTLVKVDALLVDLKKVSANADSTISNVNRTVEETREPIKKDLAEIEATLIQARQVLEDIQGLVATNEPEINETVENLRTASKNLEVLTDDLRQRPWSLIRVQPKEDRRVPLPAATR